MIESDVFVSIVVEAILNELTCGFALKLAEVEADRFFYLWGVDSHAAVGKGNDIKNIRGECARKKLLMSGQSILTIGQLVLKSRESSRAPHE